MAFIDVQNGFYNALAQGLGLPTSNFQLIQPSPPLLPDDHLLWNYFNNIPPASLTQNYIASGGNQFFSNYKGLISALKSPLADRLVKDISQTVLDEFIDFVSLKDPVPSPRQYPALFRNWAILRHPGVATKGATDFAAMLLEPIAAASIALMGYEGDDTATPPIPARQPDWDGGYKQLKAQLNLAPSRTFKFKRSSMNSNVSNTWTRGSHSGFFGLWGGSSSSSSQSLTFAQNEFSVEASFGHVLLFAPTPGIWYSSAAMGQAYSHKTGSPWDPTATINWNNTFDARNGNLTRFMTNLVVVDTMSITVKSLAKYTHDDQVVIQNNSGGGLWPFYVGGSSAGASTFTSFEDDGTMTIEIKSQPGVPIVIGGSVLPIEQYVGHSVAGMNLYAEYMQNDAVMRNLVLTPA